jgi:hypothetical protein
MREIKQFKYVGETSRSVYERSREHVADMQQLKPSSHLLKHIVDIHENENPAEIEFGLKVLKYTKSSFERQILESVVIQQERHHNLLNSKAEYNRSAVPRLTSKMGENQFKKWGEEEEKEKEKNEELENRIRVMRKERNKERRQPGMHCQPAEKRRKIDGGTQDIRRAWERPVGGGLVGKRIPTELNSEPKSKRMRYERDSIDRYAEFGENVAVEYYDWEGKMAKYRRELEREEKEKNLRMEKAKNLEKGWELPRLCRDFVREHTDEWSEGQEINKLSKQEEGN